MKLKWIESNLLETRKKQDKEKNTFEYEGWELTLNPFKSGIFPIKATKGKGLKILTPKQILQRLPMALAQVKASNTSKNLLNEIRQIIYPLFRAKEITREVYNNIMNSVKV